MPKRHLKADLFEWDPSKISEVWRRKLNIRSVAEKITSTGLISRSRPARFLSRSLPDERGGAYAQTECTVSITHGLQSIPGSEKIGSRVCWCKIRLSIGGGERREL